MTLRLPRKLIGWRRLFWLTLRRCPECHQPSRNCSIFGGDVPRGFIAGLKMNGEAWRMAKG